MFDHFLYLLRILVSFGAQMTADQQNIAYNLKNSVYIIVKVFPWVRLKNLLIFLDEFLILFLKIFDLIEVLLIDQNHRCTVSF